MTCIVTLIDDTGTIWMGGDSASTGGSSLRVRKDEKVFLNGDFLIGFCGDFRAGQLLHYGFEPPPMRKGDDAMRYMCADFTSAMAQCFGDNNYEPQGDKVETAWEFLVGFGGRIFDIGPDYSVGRVPDRFNACGSGGDVAMGAMFATDGLPPRERILTALKAAETYCSEVRGPFTVKKLPNGSR